MSDNRMVVILIIGAVAIGLSLAACGLLLSSNDHKVTFLSDRDNIAYAFVIEDNSTGEIHPLAKGAYIKEGATIRCESDDFVWVGNVWVDPNSSAVDCQCIYKGSECKFTLWTNGAKITDAELEDGRLTMDLTKMHYCMAMSLTIAKAEP